MGLHLSITVQRLSPFFQERIICVRASVDEVYLDLTDAFEKMFQETLPESLETIHGEVLKSHVLELIRELNSIARYVVASISSVNVPSHTLWCVNVNLQINMLDNCPLQNPNAQVINSSPDETLIVCAQFRLHDLNHTKPDNRTEVLKLMRSMNPQGVILTDNNMECSCNSCSSFDARFSRSLDYLWSFLDSTSVGFKGREIEERKLMEGETAKALINMCEMNERKRNGERGCRGYGGKKRKAPDEGKRSAGHKKGTGKSTKENYNGGNNDGQKFPIRYGEEREKEKPVL
ncbi:hypothetical protein L1887_16610 [Cichorium endivia]|nr:hypothetical protein L1887_16610 [Cichorium endivia]